MLTLSYDKAAPVVVLQGSHLAYQPRFAFNGSNVFGAWAEMVGSEDAIFAARFDSSAAALADAALSLVSVGWSRQLWPSIASSGGESLVVWVDERGESERGRLLGARMAMSGAPIDRTPVEIAPAVSLQSAAVVFTGTRYLVVWQEPPVAEHDPSTIIAR